MLPSIAASSSGHWNHDGSRRWQRAIRAVVAEAHVDEDVAAEPFDQRPALAGSAGGLALGADRTDRQAIEDLTDQAQRFLDFADAHPHPRVDVAFAPHRRLEAQLVVGRIGMVAARVEVAARGAADHAAAAEAQRQLGIEPPGSPRCGPAARRCCRRVRPGAETCRGSSPSTRAGRRGGRDRDRRRRRPARRSPSSADGRTRRRRRAASARAARRYGRASARTRRRCRSRRCRRGDWRRARSRPSAPAATPPAAARQSPLAASTARAKAIW